MNADDALKPCPFCGARAADALEVEDYLNDYWVECTCGVNGPVAYGDEMDEDGDADNPVTRARAVESWNARADRDANVTANEPPQEDSP